MMKPIVQGFFILVLGYKFSYLDSNGMANGLITHDKRSSGLLSDIFKLMVKEKRERDDLKEEFTKTQGKYKEILKEFYEQKAEINRLKNKKGKNGVGFSVANVNSINSLSKGNVVPFKKIYMNDGQGFETTTGKFTCPRKGLYQFSSTMITQAYNMHFNFIKNNKIIGRFYRGYTNTYGSGTGVVVVRLVPGDQVWVAVANKITDIYAYSSFHGVWISY